MQVFLSYRRANQPFADELRRRLRAWGLRVWMDTHDIPPGAHWPDAIDAALRASDVVIGVMTPDAMQSRNVKNEWDWAIVNHRRLLLLMLERCDVHMNYVSINWLDFTGDHDAAFARLEAALKSAPAASVTPAVVTPAARDDSAYLQALYERINTYLARAIFTRTDSGGADPIPLVAERTPGAVDALFEKHEQVDPLFAIGFGDAPDDTFHDFADAVNHFDGRVLLLGEPGAGKTITLLHYGRDAAVRRMQDARTPLPVLATIPTWDAAARTPLADWLQASYGAPPDAARLLYEGSVLLLLDGLDELGSEREDADGTRFDPRVRFMETLKTLPPGNRVVVTCRVRDYQEIGEKIALRGAVTLHPLDDAQLKAYLRDLPGLWDALAGDPALRARCGRRCC